MILQLGALLLYLAAGGNALLLWLGTALIATAIAMLIKAEGFIALIEIPAIFSNILSYARLMALGIASVSLAIVVNQLAFRLFHAGIVGAVMGTIILFLGQGINVILGIIGPLLHSLRLHYVEFFGKFYKGGGKPYAPFGGNIQQ